MAWQSLSDIYSEQVVRDNNATSLEPQQKEWRSLSDVYTEGTKSNYINEAGDMTITVDGQSTTFKNISDIYIKEILQKAAFHQVDDQGDDQGDMKDTIVKWVESGEWKGKDKDGIIKFIIGEINKLKLNKDGTIDEQGDTVADFKLIKADIDNLIATKQKVTSFKDALESKKFNYLDMLTRSNAGVSVLNGANFRNSSFLRNIYDFTFNKSKNVVVGPGEVAATLFTEATAATAAGDLVVGGNLIEIKKQKGMVGQTGPGEKLLDFMSKNLTPERHIQRIKREEQIETLNNLIKDNNELINTVFNQLDAEKKKLESGEALPDPKEKLLRLLQMLKDKPKFTSEDFKCTFEDNKFPIPESIVDAVGSRSSKFMPLHKIKESIKKIKSFCDFKVTTTNNLFLKRAAENPTLGLDAVNNYWINTSIPRRPDISAIIYKSELEPLQKIGALSIVDYQIKEKFVYIVITGENYTSNVIGPFKKEDTASNIQMVFDSISDITFKMSGGRDTGKIEIFQRSAPAAGKSGDDSTSSNTSETQPTASPLAADPDAAVKNIL